VPDRVRSARVIQRILLTTWPGRFEEHRIDEAASLGDEGLGLDSIEIVEFLLACEDALGARATEELLGSGPVSVGRVVEYFACA
jgi:acyl carrier protein